MVLHETLKKIAPAFDDVSGTYFRVRSGPSRGVVAAAAAGPVRVLYARCCELDVEDDEAPADGAYYAKTFLEGGLYELSSFLGFRCFGERDDDDDVGVGSSVYRSVDSAKVSSVMTYLTYI